MAYPVDTVVTELSAASVTSITVSLPEHRESDVVFVSVAHDAVATLSGPGAPWTVISTGEAGGATRLIMYAVVGSTPLSEPTVTSNISDGMNAVAVAVRDADTSNVIDAWAYGSGTGSTGISSPALTTTTAGTLLLAFHICDQQLYPRWPLDALMVLGMSADGVVTNVVGYRVGGAAGPAPAVTDGVMTSSDTWQFVYVAVKNKLNGSLPAEIKNGPTQLAQYGYATPVITGLTSLTSEIDGLTVYNAPTVTTARLIGNWDAYAVFGGTAPLNAPGWHGCSHAIASADLTNGVISLRMSWLNGANLFASRGWLIVVADISNNWSAYQLLTKGQFVYNAETAIVIDFNQAVPIASSAAPPNLEAITRIGYAYHRESSPLSTSRGTAVSQLLHWKGDEALVGGGAGSPVSIFKLAKLLKDYRLAGVSTPQGTGQALLSAPITLGDGNSVSIIKNTPGASVEYQAPSQFQKVGDLSLGISVNASAQDEVSYDFSSISSASKQLFRISPTSSPAASYSFNSAVFSGIEIEWLSGIPCDGANFFGCYQIDADGAPFSNCSFSGSVSTAGLLTSNPGNVIDCAFAQGALGGHAIEITQPGTFAFVGNTFEGYGLDGTTDAAIYNTSGGHVVLNVSGGGDTPTVRNGAGATTEVVSGAQVAVVGLATGSQVKVTKVSNGDVLFNGAESGGQISFSTTYIGAVRVDARKASASPFYKPWATQATTISGQTVEVTALQELDE